MFEKYEIIFEMFFRNFEAFEKYQIIFEILFRKLEAFLDFSRVRQVQEQAELC